MKAPEEVFCTRWRKLLRMEANLIQEWPQSVRDISLVFVEQVIHSFSFLEDLSYQRMDYVPYESNLFPYNIKCIYISELVARKITILFVPLGCDKDIYNGILLTITRHPYVDHNDFLSFDIL